MAGNNDIKNIITGNNIYIRTQINLDTTMDVINGLVDIEQNMKVGRYSDLDIQEYTPTVALPMDKTVVNVYISSGGGEDTVTFAIINLFDMIKAKGGIIRTYNISYAASNAGVIAIYGSKGFRYMASHAHNLIHFGKYTTTTARQSEMEQAFMNLKDDNAEYKDLYLKNTKLTEQEINKYFDNEGSGKLFAKDCLAKSLCDWVITPNGWTNKVEDLIQQKVR